MKKTFTILAAMMLILSVGFAQNSNLRRLPLGNKTTATAQKTNNEKAAFGQISNVFSSVAPAKPRLGSANHYRVSGNPVWDETMSYCLDGAYSNAIGTQTEGDTVYWAIKIEAAALAGRNNLTDVEFYVREAGNFTVSVCQGTLDGTALVSQSVFSTAADADTWKNVHFATPVAIDQTQDMWIVIANSDIAYPATGVAGTAYDNGKYISLDGVSFDLITNLSSSLDYTWMIRAISDTYTPQAPSIYINGPLSVRTNDTVTYSAVGAGVTTYEWTIDADYVSATNAANADVMWTTTGSKQITVSASNSAGSTEATIDVDVFSCDGITIPYTPSFTDGLGCWENYSFLEQDFGWFATSDAGLDEGQLVSISGEVFMGYFVIDVDVDNWVISPSIAMPATGNYEIAYKVKPFTTSYSGDHYGVYAIVGNDSTLLFEETLSETMTDYVQRAVAIPSSITGDFKIAFRHFNSTGGYAIVLDEINLRDLTAPEVTITGSANVENGVPAAFKAVSSNATDYAWTVDGTAVSETGSVLTHTFTADGTHTVAVEASNAAGSANAEFEVVVFSCEAVTEFPYNDGFETGLGCWTIVSNNTANDGKFGVFEDAEGTENPMAYEGTHYFQFSSYSTADDYNQYLITRELQIPEGSQLMVSFFHKGYGAEDSFRILASTTTKDISSFTEVADFPTASTSWAEVSATLPAGTKYVAINYYGNYQWYLYVDNFKIGDVTAPTVTISGPETIGAGNPATFTATSPLATSFAWTVDGTAVSSTTNTMTHTFTTGGVHTVSVTASNVAGSSSATMDVNVFACETITTFPYTQDFENAESLNCWNFIDADGDGYNWDREYWLNSVDTAGNPNPQGHNGTFGLAGSASYINNLGALSPDNWMITPAFAIPTNAAGYNLSWFVKAQDPNYKDENYTVYISTGNQISDFTNIVYNGMPSGNAWEQMAVSLEEYAGQTIYIAFRHHNSTDMFWLMIDDIAVGEGVGVQNHEVSTKVYPNPANGVLNITATSNIDRVEVYNMMGQIVSAYDANDTYTQINTNKLTNGVYTVKIFTEEGVSNKKFTISR